MYIAVVLTVFCGLRRSELLGLKWQSINFKQQTVTIKDTVVRMKTVIEKERTKNKISHRALPLSDDIMVALKAERAKQEDDKKLFGNEYYNSNYVCRRADGTTYLPNTFTKLIQRVMEKAELPVIRLHDLRHTTASILLNLGFNLKEIQEWLGHSDIATTANIYAHLDASSKQNIAAGFSKILTI